MNRLKAVFAASSGNPHVIAAGGGNRCRTEGTGNRCSSATHSGELPRSGRDDHPGRVFTAKAHAMPPPPPLRLGLVMASAPNGRGDANLEFPVLRFRAGPAFTRTRFWFPVPQRLGARRRRGCSSEAGHPSTDPLQRVRQSLPRHGSRFE
jgi:hypothetical protein